MNRFFAACRPRRVFRFLPVLPALLLLPPAGGPARGAESRPDLSAVRRVEVTGDAARLVLSARPGVPTGAQLTARREGWFGGWYSSWFHQACETASRLQVEDGVLRVDVRAARFVWAEDCTVELRAELPPGVDIRIALPAVSARLEGRFGVLEVDSAAMDLELEGSATRTRLAGDAMRVRYAETGAAPAENVELRGRAIDAALRLAGAGPLAWRVDGRAALVDSTRLNDPAATPVIAVIGDLVHLTIR